MKGDLRAKPPTLAPETRQARIGGLPLQWIAGTRHPQRNNGVKTAVNFAVFFQNASASGKAESNNE